MKLYTAKSMFNDLCRLSNKWGMFVVFPLLKQYDPYYIDEYQKALKLNAEWLDFTDDCHCEIVGNAQGFLLFDTEEECRKYYGMTHGDESTSTYPIYAQLIDNNGLYRCENT